MKRKAMWPAKRFAVWRRDGFRCAYCGVSAEDPSVVLEVDHILPIAQGGSDDMDNLTTACRPCNGRKGGRPIVLRIPKPVVKMRLRNRVRLVREERGLSQSQLARDAGVSRPTLRAIEQDDGLHEPVGSVMTALSAALDDPALFWWESEPETAAVAS